MEMFEMSPIMGGINLMLVGLLAIALLVIWQLYRREGEWNEWAERVTSLFEYIELIQKVHSDCTDGEVIKFAVGSSVVGCCKKIMRRGEELDLITLNEEDGGVE